MTGNDDFVFAIAGPEDEPEIRRLVGATPMPGPITLRFEREPDYFLGCTVMGDMWIVSGLGGARSRAQVYSLRSRRWCHEPVL